MGVLEVSTSVRAGVSLLVCTRGAAFEMDLWKFWGVSVDTTILHTVLSAPACTACTDMVYSKELERDVGEGDTEPENFVIYSFIEHDRFDFFTSEGRIWAVMYMPCVKCSCSEVQLPRWRRRYCV